jgi:hypothetical protein
LRAQLEKQQSANVTLRAKNRDAAAPRKQPRRELLEEEVARLEKAAAL